MIITHVMAQAFAVADRIVVLRHGIVAGDLATEETSPDEVVRMITGGIGRVGRDWQRNPKREGEQHEDDLAFRSRRDRRDRPRRLGGDRGAAAEMKGKIYYLVPTLLDEFQTGSIDAITKFMADVGYEVVSLDGQNRADLQLNQIDDVINLKPAAVILAAVDFDAVKPGIEKMRAAGIPVMIFDRQIKSTPSDFTSVAGTVEIGYVAADEIDPAAHREERLGQGQGAADPRRPGRPLYPRHPAGLRGEDGRPSGRRPSSPRRRCSGRPTQRRQHRPGPAPHQPRHRPDLRATPPIWRWRWPPCSRRRARSRARSCWSRSNGAPVGLDLIRKGWEQVEVEQPMVAQAAALAMFADKVVNKQEIKPGTYDVTGLASTLTIESWGPNIKIPGAAITKDNVDDPKFWGNLKPPTEPVKPVE